MFSTKLNPFIILIVKVSIQCILAIESNFGSIIVETVPKDIKCNFPYISTKLSRISLNDEFQLFNCIPFNMIRVVYADDSHLIEIEITNSTKMMSETEETSSAEVTIKMDTLFTENAATILFDSINPIYLIAKYYFNGKTTFQ